MDIILQIVLAVLLTIVGILYIIGFVDTNEVITALLTIVGILFTMRYSSKYHVRGNGKHREKYQVIKKVSHGTKSGFIDSMRIILTKSSVNTSIGFMDVSIKNNPEEICVDRYAFLDSYTHILFSPGKIISRNAMTWSENVLSNGYDVTIKSKRLDSVPFELIPKKIKNKISDCRAIQSDFEFDSNYTGYRYKSRLIILAKGIGIVFCRVEYQDNNVDIYRIRKYKVLNGKTYWLPVFKEGNYWIYDIDSQSEFTQHIISE